MAYGWQASPMTSRSTPAPSQPQPSPPQAPKSSATDMSAYSQKTSPYTSYNVPRSPQQGARQNDLSGQVPSNQIWAQAYNQGSQQYGGNTQAQSWSMPGYSTSQSYNPTTGQYGPMTRGQSWDGNMAYNAIDSRPGPITATATGVGGNQMPWQDTLTQRDAFVGNLVSRLNQYNSGQLTGRPTFDPNQILSQANDQLADGTYYNPFAQQNPDVQRAMGNATQYMTGSQWQNPFGPQANTPTPTLSQPSYDPFGPQGFGNDVFYPPPGYNTRQPSSPQPSTVGYKDRDPATWSDEDIASANRDWEERARSQAERGLLDGGGRYYRDPATGRILSDSQSGKGRDAASDWAAGEAWRAQRKPPMIVSSNSPSPRPSVQPEPLPQPTDKIDFRIKPGSAQPVQEQSQGTPYNPQAPSQGLPQAPSYGEDPIAARKRASKAQASDASSLQALRDRWFNSARTGQSYREKLGGKSFRDYTPDQLADEYTGELWKRLNDGRLSQAEYDKAVAAMDTDVQQGKAKDAQVQRINNEIANWENAYYGQRTGGPPPAAWKSHIDALYRLRAKAQSGDPAAMAWQPKMKAPAPSWTPPAGKSSMQTYASR